MANDLEEATGFKKWSRRILALGIVAVLPAEILAVRVTGQEPYPALFQPSFGTVEGAGEVVTYQQGTFSATDEFGNVVDVDPYKLLPASTVDPISIWAFNFGPESFSPDHVWHDFFVKRLKLLYPDRDFVEASIAWTSITYDLNTKREIRRQVISTVELDLTRIA